jgi:type I restriction enzyme R subunit
LIKKLANGDRQVIVTTRQKMQVMIDRRLKEGTKEYSKIKELNVAFVVDECHRAVTPETKRNIERFFKNSIWFGFTGTPIFDKNKYEQKGDLPQTTEEMYGSCLHSYTIKEAIHDGAVLGFNVENLGPKDIKKEDEDTYYQSERHMRNVLDVILNKSKSKFGMQNGKGKTYEAMLTVDSIETAQRYYDLLTKVKNDEDELKINEEVKKILPDFPKTAITFSVSENDDSSYKNQEAMKRYLGYYNKLYGTKYETSGLTAYNGNLNDRLARKEKRYRDREQQLDLVIVVDRLLTGFDAPCLATLFIDRQPMSPHGLIQAFSRTNRLFDQNKEYGQIVTFQSPKEYKEKINEALVLYSRGGLGKAIAEDWDTVLENFKLSLKTLKALVPEAADIAELSKKQKKTFIKLFRDLDHFFAHLKSFSSYTDEVIDKLDFSQDEYDDYAAVYKNVLEELKIIPDDEDDNEEEIIDDYELVGYSKFKVDFEYIVELLQGFVDYLDQSENDFDETEFEKKILLIKEVVKEFSEDNTKLSDVLLQVLDEIEKNKEKFMGQDISVIINQMRYDAVDKEIERFSSKWFVDYDDVKYEAYNYKDGIIANENKLKEKADYAAYKASVSNPMPKFKFNSNLVKDFK